MGDREVAAACRELCSQAQRVTALAGARSPARDLLPATQDPAELCPAPDPGAQDIRALGGDASSLVSHVQTCSCKAV